MNDSCANGYHGVCFGVYNKQRCNGEWKGNFNVTLGFDQSSNTIFLQDSV